MQRLGADWIQVGECQLFLNNKSSFTTNFNGWKPLFKSAVILDTHAQELCVPVFSSCKFVSVFNSNYGADSENIGGKKFDYSCFFNF